MFQRAFDGKHFKTKATQIHMELIGLSQSL
jgi:hypothetical protein